TGVLGSTGCQPVGLGSLPRSGEWVSPQVASAKMLPAGLPVTTGWQPVLPRARYTHARFKIITAHFHCRGRCDQFVLLVRSTLRALYFARRRPLSFRCPC